MRIGEFMAGDYMLCHFTNTIVEYEGEGAVRRHNFVKPRVQARLQEQDAKHTVNFLEMLRNL